MKRLLLLLAATAVCPNCNSQTWSSLLGGTNNQVNSLYVYNNELYVGGSFEYVNGINMYGIARWNGSSWNTVDSGINGAPFSLTVYNNELLAGGFFWSAYGVPNTLNIARWNGTNWLSAGSTNNDEGEIRSMAVCNNELYIGGVTTKIGGVSVNRIAKWNGSVWSGVSGGVTAGFMPRVNCMATLNNKLYVAGDFNYAGSTVAFNIASWDGTQWMTLDTGLNEYARAITADTVNNIIYVAGIYIGLAGGINGIPVNSIAGWDGNNWFSLGQGLSGNAIYCMTMYHGELYVGGEMFIVGSDSATIYIAKWNGSQWSKVLGTNGPVFSMKVYNDTLYVGGGFTYPGNNIARYYSPLANVSEEEKKTEQEYLGNNIPNPFKTITTIPYFIPNGSTGIMTITDIDGRKVKTYSLSEGSNMLVVSLEGYGNGMYFYTLNIDEGRIVRHKKMTLNW